MCRAWVCGFLFTLTFINYTDRVALFAAAEPISAQFLLSPVEVQQQALSRARLPAQEEITLDWQ